MASKARPACAYNCFSQAWIQFGWTSQRCAKSATVACRRKASEAVFAFSAVSIFRLVLVIAPAASRTEQPTGILANGPKNWVHFTGLPESHFDQLGADRRHMLTQR